MIIECPACHTRYRTDSASVEAGVIYECTQEQCGERFAYTPPPRTSHRDKAVVPPSPQVMPVAEDEPGLFADEPGLFVDEDDEDSHVPEDEHWLGSSRSGRQPAPEPSYEDEEEEPASERFSFSPVVDEDLPHTPGIGERYHTAQITEVSLSFGTVFAILALMVLGYAVVGWYSLSRIDIMPSTLARLPLVGTVFASGHFSSQQLALADVQGEFWLTKDNRRVFVVSGKVVNHASLPAREVQVEGTLYDAEGKEVGRQLSFCGTKSALPVLEGITVREVGILQNLVPPKDFEVTTGQEASCLVFFTKPPPNIAEFSCRVAAVKFAAP
jgi:hypothetical protein